MIRGFFITELFSEDVALKTSVFQLGDMSLLIFSVTPFKIDQNKKQNRSLHKVRNMGNERR